MTFIKTEDAQKQALKDAVKSLMLDYGFNSADVQRVVYGVVYDVEMGQWKANAIWTVDEGRGR